MKGKCIELVAVMSDGTVERMTGNAVADAWKEMLDHAGECGDLESVDWETTKPLRKVTTLRGRYWWVDGACGIAPLESVDSSYGTPLGEMLPFGTRAGNDLSEGPLCDWRITVEAIPVKEDPR